jgi:TatD DNase family protein
LLQKIKYIDIHTHQENAAENILAIRNVYPSERIDFKADSYYSIGLHPWYIPDKGAGQFLNVMEELARRKEVAAIGECGLDKLSKSPMDIQMFVFEKHIEIAEKVQKPLIIHCVRSFNELVQTKIHSGSSVEWIVHGFNAKLQVADMLLRHEMYLSFGKALLNPESNASKMLPQIEDEMFLLETDDAAISIEEVYKTTADRLHMDIDFLQLLMQTNFINCFKL